jgi:hypothetical protein
VVLARGQKEYASSAHLTEQKQVLPALHQDKTPSSSRPSYRLQATPPAWTTHPTHQDKTPSSSRPPYRLQATPPAWTTHPTGPDSVVFASLLQAAGNTSGVDYSSHRTRLRRLRVPPTGCRQHLRRGLLIPQNAEAPSVASSKSGRRPVSQPVRQAAPTSRAALGTHFGRSLRPRTQSPTPKSRATLGRHSDAVSDPKRQDFLF